MKRKTKNWISRSLYYPWRSRKARWGNKREPLFSFPFFFSRFFLFFLLISSYFMNPLRGTSPEQSPFGSSHSSVFSLVTLVTIVTLVSQSSWWQRIRRDCISLQFRQAKKISICSNLNFGCRFGICMLKMMIDGPSLFLAFFWNH